MTDLTALTLAEARDRLRKEEFSAGELAEAHLAAIERRARSTPMCWRRRTRRARWRRRRTCALRAGEARPLEGIALGVKDMFATKDVRTTACSRILDNFVPTYESTVTANLWRDGAVHARQAQQRRVRDGLVERDLAVSVR